MARLYCFSRTRLLAANRIRGYHLSLPRIRISEAEAARDFAAVMTRVREGAEVIIENGTLPVAVIRK
jgi:hypothetical protein